jgi:hypothetical protein
MHCLPHTGQESFQVQATRLLLLLLLLAYWLYAAPCCW